jgi:nucleoside-diphosphate-sugar epimerase
MKIVIIGCGYLGTALAKHFSKLGHEITATSKSSKRLKSLSKIVQRGIIGSGSDEKLMQMLVDQNDLILMTLSSVSFNDYETTFLKTAQTLRKAALKSQKPKKLIYTSNTSVYGEYHGQWVNETTPLNPISHAAQTLIDTENVLLSLETLHWQVTILRLGVIYGPGRDLVQKVKDVQGNVLPGLDSHYTNMVHLDDVVESIDHIITHQLTGIYNLSDDDHPTRKEMFDEICQKFHLPNLKWNPSESVYHNGNKRVSNVKLKSTGYQFIHPHREYKKS